MTVSTSLAEAPTQAKPLDRFLRRHFPIGPVDRKLQPQTLPANEQSAFHEAAHAIVAAELGQTVTRVWIANHSDGGGVCEITDRPEVASHESIRDDLTVAVAGQIAVCLAQRNDWRTVDLQTVLATEEPRRNHFRRAVQKVRGQGVEAAQEWVDTETPRAARRARDILIHRWMAGPFGGVLQLAWALLNDWQIDYLEASR